MLAFVALRPPPTHGPFGRDFEAYYAAGATWNAGGDPWSRDVWATERTIPGVDRGDELLPFVGPAFALPLFGALARAPFATSLRIWSALIALAFGALVLGALALARERRIPAFAGALLLGIASAPGISDFALAQAAMLSAGAIACALFALERGALPAGAASVLIAGIQPNLALGLIARLRERVAWLATLLALATYAAVTLAAGGGVAGLIRYVHDLAAHGDAERFIAIQYTPAAIAYALGAGDGVARAVGIIVAALAVVLVATAIVRARLGALDGALLALAALPFAVPFFHQHDFVVVLIPLIVLAVRTRGTPRAMGGIAAALICVDWFGLAQRPAAGPQIVATGLACAFAFVALGRGRRATRADAAAALTVAVLACMALPLARAHRAPTWPDALPAAYRAPAAASAAVVWADEQRAAGLARRDAAWGVLRALPLCGCVLLAAACVRGARKDGEREARPG